MINKYLIVGYCAHFLLSLSGFLALNAAVVGVLDAGTAEPGVLLQSLRVAVDYALLQPLGYWLILATEPRWWTWQGLAAVTTLLGLNSAIVAAAVGLLVRRLTSSRS